MRPTIAFLAVVLLCAHTSGQTHSAAKRQALSSGGGVALRCSLAKVIDTDQSGMVAYTYLVPEGWRATNWLKYQNKVPIANMGAETLDRMYSVNLQLPLNLTYNMAAYGRTFGTRIKSALDAIHLLTPQLVDRAKASNLQLFDEHTVSLPPSSTMQMSEQYQPMGQVSANYHESAFAQFSYDLGGVPMKGMISTSVVAIYHGRPDQTGGASDAGSGNYSIGPTLIVISPRDASSKRIREGKVIVGSMCATPDWARHLIALTGERAQDTRAGTELLRKSFRVEMAARNQSNHNFLEYLSDQGDYRDQSGQKVTMPSGYNHYYSNGQGKYILTNDHMFDPKSVEGGDWRQMERAN